MQMYGEMRFEERRISLGAEPIDVAELVEGNVYFAIRYLDENLLVPTVDTLVFIGHNLEVDDVGLLYFQPASAHEAGYKYRQGDKSKELGLELYLESSANNIFEYEKALDELMRCSLRRKTSGTS